MDIRAFYKKNRHVVRLVGMIVVWTLFMTITSDKFFKLTNFVTIASKIPEYGLMSLGAMVCMITGGIDLSAVGIANFASILMALFMRAQRDESGAVAGWVIPAGLIGAVLIGLICGAFNGVLVSKIKIPPILTTLGVNQLLTGLSMVVTQGKAVDNIPADYVANVSKKLLEVVPGKRGKFSGLIPVPLIAFVVAVIVIWFLLSKTTYGRKLYMIGTNENVARFSGLRVDRILIVTYIISGICAALGGMIMLANYSVARPDYGSQYTLQCILIAVLGGVDPNGGRGKTSGVVLAIVLLALLEAGINRFDISPYYITLIWGAVLLLVMVLDHFTDKSQGKA